jgi:hypothetical protein
MKDIDPKQKKAILSEYQRAFIFGDGKRAIKIRRANAEYISATEWLEALDEVFMERMAYVSSMEEL